MGSWAKTIFKTLNISRIFCEEKVAKSGNFTEKFTGRGVNLTQSIKVIDVKLSVLRLIQVQN